MKKYARVLSVAGSDSGGGAGIQADIKAISATGGFAMTAITALTSQNTKGVTGVHPVPSQFIKEQIDVSVEDIGCDAIKLGMLFNSEIVSIVADCIEAWNIPNVVLDPVMVATSGDRLLLEDAVSKIKERLIPISEIVTPNLGEAELLADMKIDSEEKMIEAGQYICSLGAKYALIKGGHFEGEEARDCLVSKAGVTWFSAKRIDTKNTHGTGCTLSSAIASYLAQGFNTEKSVELAKEYLTKAIQAGSEYEIGHGHGPVCHNFEMLK